MRVKRVPGSFIIIHKNRTRYVGGPSHSRSAVVWVSDPRQARIFPNKEAAWSYAYNVKTGGRGDLTGYSVLSLETILAELAARGEPETLRIPQPSPNIPPPVQHAQNEMLGDALQKVIAALQEESTACDMYFQATARRKSAEATYRFLSGTSA